MSFTRAVQDLVHCHNSDIEDLQKQINHLRALLNRTPTKKADEDGLVEFASSNIVALGFQWNGNGVSIEQPPKSELIGLLADEPRSNIISLGSMPEATERNSTPGSKPVGKRQSIRFSVESYLSNGLLSQTSATDSSIMDSSVIIDFGPELDGVSPGKNISEVASVGKICKRWEVLAGGVISSRKSAEFLLHEGWTTVSFGDGLSEKTFEKMKQELKKQELKSKRLLKLASRYSDTSNLSNFFLKRLRWSTNNSSFDESPIVCMLHPASRLRRFWVCMCMLVIVYEIFVLTMSPFDFIKGDVAKAIEWMSAIFWVADIFVNFISGIYMDGKTELRFCVIAKKYLKTWFSFDLIVATTQLIVVTGSSENLSATFFLRIIRAVRSLRIARIFYWLKGELGLSNSAVAGGKLLQSWLILYFFIHCSACVWFALGKSRDGWVDAYADQLTNDPAQNYLVSLHWSLSQLQGNIDIYPGRALGNRLFAVISSALSIVALTFFVSSMTDTLFDVRQQEKRRLDIERLTNSFFGRHGEMKPEVRARAEHFISLKQKQQNALEDHEQDQCVLAMFPEKITKLLLSEMRTRYLNWHPVFAYLQRFHKKIFVAACAEALSLQMYAPFDDVFTRGELSKQAHFVEKGEFVISLTLDLVQTVTDWLSHAESECSAPPPGATARATRQSMNVRRYSQVAGRITNRIQATRKSFSPGRLTKGHGSESTIAMLNEQFDPVRKVTSGQMVSEVSLWASWVHVGEMYSTGHCQCFRVGTDELVCVLKGHPAAHAAFASYASRFVDAAKALRESTNGRMFYELMGFNIVMEHEAYLKELEGTEDSLVDNSLVDNSMRLSEIPETPECERKSRATVASVRKKS